MIHAVWHTLYWLYTMYTSTLQLTVVVVVVP